MNTQHADILFKLLRKISREQRNDLICAMLRVNYETPWVDDEELLKRNFPKVLHCYFQPAKLTSVIEQLGPVAEEETQNSIEVDQLDQTLKHEVTVFG